MGKTLKKKTIQPIHDFVLIKPIIPETKTASGIIIPDIAIERQFRGTVIEMGGGKKDEPMTVKKGDMVMHNKNAGMEIEYNGEKHLLMKESEILAII